MKTPLIILAMYFLGVMQGYVLNNQLKKVSHADSCWENLKDLDAKYQHCLDNWEKEVIK